MQEQACCRDSRSTISAFDSLGRPAIHRSTERYQHRDENMYRVEEFVRSSVSSVSVSPLACCLGMPVLDFTQLWNARSEAFPSPPCENYTISECYCFVSFQQKAHYYQPLVANNYSVGNSHDGFRHLNGSAIIAADGGSRQGSVLKNHQVPPMSYGYSSVMDDEDVDEGLGGPASQEHPDDQDSVTNSFHVSEPHCS